MHLPIGKLVYFQTVKQLKVLTAISLSNDVTEVLR